MSSGWHMCSFNQERFNELFLSGSSKNMDRFEELLSVVEDDEEEVEVLLRLAKQITEKGLSYDGLNNILAEQLDYLIILSFTEYPTDKFLNTEQLTDDFISSEVFHTLYNNFKKHHFHFLLKELNLIEAFCIGRRYNHNDISSNCEYFIASPLEISLLINSIQKLLALNNIKESKLIIDFLLEPLKDCLDQGTPLFMYYG